MTIKGKAYIAGIYEHPSRKADDKSLALLHAEVARGALYDAGLTRGDVDGYFCAGDAPGLGPESEGRLQTDRGRSPDPDVRARLIAAHTPGPTRTPEFSPSLTRTPGSGGPGDSRLE